MPSPNRIRSVRLLAVALSCAALAAMTLGPALAAPRGLAAASSDWSSGAELVRIRLLLAEAFDADDVDEDADGEEDESAETPEVEDEAEVEDAPEVEVEDADDADEDQDEDLDDADEADEDDADEADDDDADEDDDEAEEHDGGDD